MTVIMQLKLILKYFKTAWPGGRVGGLFETGNKAISVSIEVEVEVELS